MKDESTYAWIFMSVPEEKPGSIDAILGMADAINKAVPSQKELKESLSWLQSKGFVKNTGERYSLTEVGRGLMNSARTGRRNGTKKGRRNMWDTWNALEREFKDMR